MKIQFFISYIIPLRRRWRGTLEGKGGWQKGGGEGRGGKGRWGGEGREGGVGGHITNE
jgi:hypothetical protein